MDDGLHMTFSFTIYKIYSLKDFFFFFPLYVVFFSLLLCFAGHYLSIYLTPSSSKLFNELNKLHVNFELGTHFFQLKMLLVMTVASL